MSVKLNLGVSKKIGLPEYSSASGTCFLEVEVDSSVLDNPETFQRKVREVYAACRVAVEEELANHRPNATPKQDVRPTTAPATEYRNSVPPERENPYPISEKQLAFIGKLSKGIRGLTAQKLDEYCRVTFGKPSVQLSAREGSQLIDDLKAAKAGKELV